MRRQTSPDGSTGTERGGERHQPLAPRERRLAQRRMRRQQRLEAAPRAPAQRAGHVLGGERVGEVLAAVVHVTGRCALAAHGGIEAALQRRQRAAHPRLDGAERLAHLGRDFGVAEPLEEGEGDALPLARRELFHARRERTRLGSPAQQIERAGRFVGHGVVHVVVLAVAALARWSGGAHLGLGLQAAQAVDGAVARNAREPREGLALRRVEAARRPPDVDVHLLQDVFGLGSVPVDTQHDGEQMRAGPLVERGKSRTIADSGASQQARQIMAALGPVGGRSEHGCGLQAGWSAPLRAFLQFQRPEG
jgi:hypothetical protein